MPGANKTSQFVASSSNISSRISSIRPKQGSHVHSRRGIVNGQGQSQGFSSKLYMLFIAVALLAAAYLFVAFHATTGLRMALQRQWLGEKDKQLSSREPAISTTEVKSIIDNLRSNIPSTSTVMVVSPEQQPIERRCPDRRPVPARSLPIDRTAPGASNMHFIHIPKCGGTSMTAVLREMACAMNPEKNVDCCTNPGFCDWHAHRRCSIIKGCTDHFPNRAWIFKPMPSVALLRNPTSRILSAWFYRGHSPNLDFFQVRPWFKEIQLGLRPRVVFDEYIEMVEYQNIQTRMLGADSFPYRNISITEEIFCKAVEALDNLYFVGLQEAYDISVEAILREFSMNITVEVKKERDQGNKQISEQKALLKNNATLMARVKDINHYDYALYSLAVEKFCNMIRKHQDLHEKLLATTSVKC